MSYVKQAVVKILTPYLDEYVDNFSAQNMKFGLWKGQVVVQEVQLKKDILKKFNLPFKLKYSRLGKLTMTIPWSSLTSSKTEIVIEGLELLINELPQNSWEVKNSKIIEQRKKEIQSYCEEVLKDFAQKIAKKNQKQEDSGYFSRMVINILDNLQITVKDIHIRVQDSISNNYAFGVTLEQLQIFTVNKNDEPQFIDRTKAENKNQPIRKKLLLSNFGIYWDQKAQFFPENQIKEKMLSTIARKDSSSRSQLNYVILLSSKMKLLQRQVGKQFNDPQLALQVKIDELKIEITNMQLQQIVTMGQRLQRFFNQLKSKNKKKLTYSEIQKNKEQFIQIFKKNYEKKSLTQEQNLAYQNILQSMEVQNFKDQIKGYLQVKQKDRIIQQTKNKSRGWFSGPTDLTQQQRNQIERLFDSFGTEVKVTTRPKDYFYISFKLYLQKLEIIVANNSNKMKSNLAGNIKQGIATAFYSMNMQFLLRENGYLLNFALANFQINLFTEITDEKNNLLKKETKIFLEKFQRQESSINKNYLQLLVQGNPLSMNGIDTSVKLVTSELLLTFDPQVIKIGLQFAQVLSLSQQNQQIAMEKFGEYKELTSAAVANTMKKQKKNFIYVDITVNSIIAVIYLDPKKSSEKCWVFNLGKLKMFSDQSVLKNTHFSPTQPKEKYCLELEKTSFQYYHTPQLLRDPKKTLQQVKLPKFQLLSQLSLDVSLQIFQSDLIQIPKIRMIAKMHTVDLNLNAFTYQNVLKIGDCFAYESQPLEQLVQKKKLQRALQKKEVMAHKKKIGMVYFKQYGLWKPFIAVYSGNYIYLYEKGSKSDEYISYIYVKNAQLKLTQLTEISNLQKPFVLSITSKIGQKSIGFNQKSHVDAWVKILQENAERDKELGAILQLGFLAKQKQLQKSISKINANQLNFQFKAEIQKINIKVILSEFSNYLLLLEIGKISLALGLHEKKIQVKLGLKSLSLFDTLYDFKDKQLNNFLYSKDNEKSQQLILIQVCILNRDHPEYNFIDTQLEVSFGTLICNYKPFTVAKVMMFFLPKPDENQSKKQQKEQKKTQSQEAQNKIPSLALQSKEVFSIKAKVQIDEVSIAMVNDKSKTLIARASVKDFYLSFAQSNIRMLLNGGLDQLLYIDYSGYPYTNVIEKSNYDEDIKYLIRKCVLSQQKIDLLIQKTGEIDLEIHEKNKTSMINYDIEIRQKPKPGTKKKMFINANLVNLEVTYYQQPVLRLITYLTTQLLPSLTPYQSQESEKNKKIQPQKQEKKKTALTQRKPEQPPMELCVNVRNIQVLIQPVYKQQIQEKQFLKLIIKDIEVTNSTIMREYIKNLTENEQRVMVQNYLVQIKQIIIFAQYSNLDRKISLKPITNSMNLRVSSDLIQNSDYYQKLYKKRFLPGIRVNCQMTPFLMRINHNDYNFVMKCLNYCIIYNDNAEDYLYDILKNNKKNQVMQRAQSMIVPQKSPAQNSQVQPIFFGIVLHRISLCVTQKNVPISMLSIDQLTFKFQSIPDQYSKMDLIIKHIVGTSLILDQNSDQVVERGMFNSFGYQRSHKKSSLDSMQGLLAMFSQSQSQIKDSKSMKPALIMTMNMDTQGNNLIDMQIEQITINLYLGIILILSKLAIVQQNAQPPKPNLEPTKHVESIINQSQISTQDKKSGKMNIVIRLNNFIISVSDDSNKNHIYMQGNLITKLFMNSSVTDKQALELAQHAEQQRFIHNASHIVKLQDFSLYFCNTKDLKNKRQMIRPFDIQISYGEFYTKHKNNVIFLTQIDGSSGQIIIEATIKDILNLNNMIQNNLKILNENAPKNQNKQQLPKQNQSPKLRRETSGPVINNVYQVNNALIQKVVEESKKQIHRKLKAKFTLKPLEALIVNDCNQNFMPVIKFILQDSEPIFSSSSIETKLAYNLVMSLYFFNPRSSKWQPVIQPYQVSLVYSSTMSQYGPVNLIIIQNSEAQQLKELRLSLSTQFLLELMQTLDIAKQQKQILLKEQQIEHVQVSPFYFQNVTNHQIYIKRIIDKKENIFVMDPFFSGPVRLSPTAENFEFEINGTKQKLSLQHYGIVKVPSMNYFVEFKVNKLSRLIRFLTPKILRNVINRKIYCKLIQKGKQRIVKIQPRKQIPLDETQKIMISLNETTYSHDIQLRNAEKTSFLTSSKHEEGKENGMKFKLILSKEQKIIKGATFQKFELKSPIIIYNCLPKNIQMQFFFKEKLNATKTIKAQECRETFVENIYKSSFQILIEGYYWSQQIRFSEQIIGKQMTIVLMDKRKKQTIIKYRFDRRDNHQFNFQIYCKAFLVSQLEGEVEIFANLAKRSQKNKQNHYYNSLGGQQVGKQNKNEQDSIVLIGQQSADLIRVCSPSTIYDFTKPIPINGIGLGTSRIVLQKQIKGQKKNVFTLIGTDVSLKQMHKDIQIFSKQIKIRNRCIFFNSSDKQLFLKQQFADTCIFSIKPGQKKPYIMSVPQRSNQDVHRIRLMSQSSMQSELVSIDSPGAVFFRLREGDQKFYNYKIVIQQVNKYMFYDIKAVQQADLPYQIMIKSDKLSVYVPKLNKKIKYGQKLYYMNDNKDTQQHFEIVIEHSLSQRPNKVEVYPDNLSFKEVVRFSIMQNKLAGTSFVQIYVLMNDRKKYIVIDEGTDNSNDDFQFKTTDIHLKMDKLSLSFIHNHIAVPKPFQSFFFYIENFEFISQATNKTTKYQAKIQFIQFDQQYPYILANPVVMTPYKYKQFTQPKDGKPPSSIVNIYMQLNNSFVENMFINSLIIQFNNLVLCVSQDFIKVILQLIQQFQDSMNVKQEDYYIKWTVQKWRQFDLPKQGSKTFIKSIKIAPFQADISAQLNFKKGQNDRTLLFFGTMLNALGVMITNIENLVITLDGLQINDCIDTIDGLQSKILAHYKFSVLKQIYKVFGSLNILGNPVGLFRNISTGFKNLKDKPAQGFVKGPLQFGKGLAQGTGSLLANSAAGALNSVQKFTGTIGSGLAVLTFDDQFQERRQKANMKKPKHVFQGLQKGGKAVFHGFKDGITGIFTKPYENTKKEGFKGFFKGTAQGLTGIITKPVAGLFDFASNTTQGLKNTALSSQDRPNDNRIRYPRVFYTQCYTVRDYSIVDSKINFILQKFDYYQKNEDSYFVDSYLVDEKQNIFLTIMRRQIISIIFNEEKIKYTASLSKVSVQQGQLFGKKGIRLIINGNRPFDEFLKIEESSERAQMLRMIDSIKNEYD